VSEIATAPTPDLITAYAVPVIDGVKPQVTYMFDDPQSVQRLAVTMERPNLVEHHYDPDPGHRRESWILSLSWAIDGVYYSAQGPRTYEPTLVSA
jgi:hypothetical protein